MGGALRDREGEREDERNVGGATVTIIFFRSGTKDLGAPPHSSDNT